MVLRYAAKPARAYRTGACVTQRGDQLKPIGVEFMCSHLGRFLFFSALILLNVAPAAAEVKEGMPAPAVRTALLDGRAFDSAQQRGKVIVLNFWATWCTPCREEMPALEAYYRAHRAEGLEVIAISIEDPDDLAKVKNVVRNYSFPVALAAGGQIEGYGRLSRVPVTFVIDRDGVLRFDGFKFKKVLSLTTLEQVVTPLLRNSKKTAVGDAGPVREIQLARRDG